MNPSEETRQEEAGRLTVAERESILRDVEAFSDWTPHSARPTDLRVRHHVSRLLAALDGAEAEVARLQAENSHRKDIVESLAERVHKQSDLLGKRAEGSAAEIERLTQHNRALAERLAACSAVLARRAERDPDRDALRDEVSRLRAAADRSWETLCRQAEADRDALRALLRQARAALETVRPWQGGDDWIGLTAEMARVAAALQVLRAAGV